MYPFVSFLFLPSHHVLSPREFYTTWFIEWGRQPPGASPAWLAQKLQGVLDLGASVNVYVSGCQAPETSSRYTWIHCWVALAAAWVCAETGA